MISEKLPILRVSKTFSFDAAHQLTRYHGKCEDLHGHTYTLVVTVEGPVHEDGMVMDFVLLKKLVNERILSKLDHSNLNDTMDNPSAENIAIWVWDRLSPFPELSGVLDVRLKEVKVCETLTTCAIYFGPIYYASAQAGN